MSRAPVSPQVYTCTPITLCSLMALMEGCISKVAATAAECWNQSYSKSIPAFLQLYTTSQQIILLTTIWCMPSNVSCISFYFLKVQRLLFLFICLTTTVYGCGYMGSSRSSSTCPFCFTYPTGVSFYRYILHAYLCNFSCQSSTQEFRVF